MCGVSSDVTLHAAAVLLISLCYWPVIKTFLSRNITVRDRVVIIGVSESKTGGIRPHQRPGISIQFSMSISSHGDRRDAKG
jgi:hypothetical protein